MNQIRGFFFSGQTSSKREALLEVLDGRLNIKFVEAKAETNFRNFENVSYNLNEIKVHPPLGSSARTIEFDDGSKFETFDFKKFDLLFPARPTSSFVHKLESHLPLALGGCVLLILILFALYRYFIPAASNHIAQKAPYKILQIMESGTKKTLKRMEVHLKPIDSKKFPKAKTIFKEVEKEYQDLNIHIQVTNAPLLKANAFALPAGQIVVTESLLNTVNNGELYAILLHEVGHVHHRHGLQEVIKSSGLFIIFSLVLGVTDLSSIPLALLSANYSRDSETEADKFSAQSMRQKKLDPTLLISGLRKIEKKRIGPKSDKQESVMSIFSTHPLTSEREKNIRQLRLKK